MCRYQSTVINNLKKECSKYGFVLRTIDENNYSTSLRTEDGDRVVLKLSWRNRNKEGYWFVSQVVGQSPVIAWQGSVGDSLIDLLREHDRLMERY